jgi:hypothetical protein
MGANRSIFTFSPDSQVVRSVLDLESVFYEFGALSSDGVVAVFETAVVGISAGGEARWRHDTDLISDFRFESDRVVLELFDGDSLVLDGRSGEQIG